MAFSSVSSGRDFTRGIRAADAEVECWGASFQGQPMTAPSGIAFISVTALDRYACGVRKRDGVEVCWGSVARGIP